MGRVQGECCTVASKLHMYDIGTVCVYADVLYVRTYTITLWCVLFVGLCWLQPG